MVSFAPKIEDTGVQIRGAVNEQSFATLFEGLGNAAMQTVAVTDQAIQGRIQKEAETLFQEVSAPYNEMVDTPVEIQQAARRMERLQSALEQGKISDTQFYGQLVAGVKKMKTKYPGYSKIIDEVIQSTTGIRPANALRNVILGELESAMKEQEASRSDAERFILRNDVAEVIGGAHPEVYADIEGYLNDPAKQAQVKSTWARETAYKASLEVVKSELAVDKQTYERNERLITQNVNDYVGNKVADSIAGISRAAEQQYGSGLNKLMSDLSSGKRSIDPAQLEDFRTQLGIRRNELYQELQREIAQNTNGHMAPDAVRNLLNDSLKPFDDIISLLGSGDYDLAGRAARTTKIMQERDLNGLLVGSKDLRLLSALKEISPQLAEVYAQGDAGSELQQVISTINLQNMAFDGQTIGEAIDRVMSNNKLSEGEAIRGVRATIEGVSTILSDPNADQKTLREVINNTYSGPDIFDDFGDTSQVEVFKKLTSKKITQNIVNTGDPALIQQYYNWAVESTYKVNTIKDALQEINNIQGTRDFLVAEMSEKGQLTFKVDEEKFKDWASKSSPGSINTMTRSIKNAVKGIETFNAISSNMAPIMEAVGKQPKEDMQTLLSNLAIDVDTRGDGLLQKMFDTLGKGAGTELFPSEGRGERSFKNLDQILNEISPSYSEGRPYIQGKVQFFDDTKGKIRDKPIQPKLRSNIEQAALRTDPEIGIKVVSGGQNPLGVGGKRTGSTRHDDGNAADIVLMKNGKPVYPNQDKELYARFLRNAAAQGMTGLGHYPWGIHVGGGKRAAWGPDKTAKTLDPVFAKAIREGWAMR